MKNNVTVGLTGPTGAGKSTVAGLLREHGFAVIDADHIAREITLPGSPVLTELAGAFGTDILNTGVLDRAKLAERAFSTPERTQTLNAITHPHIVRRMEEERENVFRSGARVAVMDGAQLFEAGADRICDLVAVVTAPDDVRLARLIRRDGLPVEKLKERMAAQLPRSCYEERADIIIRNYPPFLLEQELGPLYEKIEEALT